MLAGVTAGDVGMFVLNAQKVSICAAFSDVNALPVITSQ
jgi:hypothetical protein